MEFDWKKLIGSVAPTIATALGGPLAGYAVREIGTALGLEAATESTISTALQNATPETLLRIKELDQSFALKMEQMGIDVKKLEFEDTSGARAMLIQTRARTPAILSYFIVVSITALYAYLIMGDYNALSISDLVLGRILGTLDTAFAVVLAFWLGSAHREPYQAAQRKE